MANYSVKYNSSSVHIAGLEMKTAANEFTMNACASLTRYGHSMATARGGDIETAEQALKKAKSLARSIGKKMCKRCEAAALSMIDEQTAGETYRFLVATSADDEEGTEVRVTAGSRAEAKALARQTPGAVSVVSLG